MVYRPESPDYKNPKPTFTESWTKTPLSLLASRLDGAAGKLENRETVYPVRLRRRSAPAERARKMSVVEPPGNYKPSDGSDLSRDNEG